MLLDSVPYRIGKQYKYLVKCDWEGCTEEFYHGGNPSGPHYCIEVHRTMNKNLKTEEARKRRENGIRVKGTSLDKRLVTTKRDRTWQVHIPRCPVCGDEISAKKDCKCP